MVPFLTALLGISIVGLLCLIILKRVELSSGRTMFAGARPGMDGFFHHSLMFVEHVLPSMLRYSFRSLWRLLRRSVQRFIAWMIFSFEHGLERMLHTVREKTEVKRSAGEVSSFLREIADHKRELLTRKKGDRIILDE